MAGNCFVAYMAKHQVGNARSWLWLRGELLWHTVTQVEADDLYESIATKWVDL